MMVIANLAIVKKLMMETTLALCFPLILMTHLCRIGRNQVRGNGPRAANGLIRPNLKTRGWVVRVCSLSYQTTRN
jgi:uncharacterized membrane protein